MKNYKQCIYEDYECCKVFNEIVFNIENSKFVGKHRVGFVDEDNNKHILIEFPLISQEKLEDILKCFGSVAKINTNLECNIKTIGDCVNRSEKIDNNKDVIENNKLKLIPVYNIGKNGKNVKISEECLEKIKECLDNMKSKLGPRMKFTDYNKIFELRCIKNLPIKDVYEQLGIGNKTYAKRYNEIVNTLKQFNISFK